MNRSELVAALADRAGVARKDADAVLAAFAEVVGDVVSKGDEKVTVPGFLTFERTHRAAREGRNPASGERITIPMRLRREGLRGLEAQGSRQGGVAPPGIGRKSQSCRRRAVDGADRGIRSAPSTSGPILDMGKHRY